MNFLFIPFYLSADATTIARIFPFRNSAAKVNEKETAMAQSLTKFGVIAFMCQNLGRSSGIIL
ncbi:MAG: hypothetical protein AMJ73_08260 [candidate division Zixibacteria bacterium SM1_73]|nr:MAG: hypothetical protein AMJ73_08260 [candidate division Zixibacteria bacterium SM1_73]